MLSPLARALAVVLAAAVAPACTQANPFFVPVGENGTTTSAASASSTDGPAVTTTEPGSGSESAGDSSAPPTTSGVEPGTTAATSSSSDQPVDTSTGEPSDTGEPPPDTSTGVALDTGDPPLQVVPVLATVATCVLLPNLNLQVYTGPQGCETIVGVNDGVPDVGVMILDTNYFNAAGRESRIYLSFAIPAPPDGKDLVGAALIVQGSSSPDAGAVWSGDLYLSDAPFTDVSLEAGAPGGTLLVPDPGPSFPNTASVWEIPTNVLMAGQPVYFGLGAKSNDGVLYRSGAAPAQVKPRLELTYQ